MNSLKKCLLPLIGKTIREIYLSKDQSLLAFKCGCEDSIAYEAYGDCCSESWFADIIGVDYLLGNTILEVSEVCTTEVGLFDSRSRQESDVVYSFKLKTNKGSTEFIFRNSSNGYYGGDICKFNSNNLPDGMQEITQDFSA